MYRCQRSCFLLSGHTCRQHTDAISFQPSHVCNNSATSSTNLYKNATAVHSTGCRAANSMYSSIEKPPCTHAPRQLSSACTTQSSSTHVQGCYQQAVKNRIHRTVYYTITPLADLAITAPAGITEAKHASSCRQRLTPPPARPCSWAATVAAHDPARCTRSRSRCTAAADSQPDETTVLTRPKAAATNVVCPIPTAFSKYTAEHSTALPSNNHASTLH